MNADRREGSLEVYEFENEASQRWDDVERGAPPDYLLQSDHEPRSGEVRRW